jgi:NAD(P)-dependent dehydrogenase (short-subunit alcohol dehydrogenase family)
MSKVALVTGGSRGIGFGIAEKLAAEKWDLVINGIRPEDAVAEPLSKLRSMGVRVGYARGDVGSVDGRAAIVKATKDFVAAWSVEQGARSSEFSDFKSKTSGLPSPSSGLAPGSRLPAPGLNLLVNNAGVAPKVRADLLETSEESYDHVIDTNLKGVFFLTQAFARDMVAAKKADPKFTAMIVNITSISATVVSINRGEYCIAKAGLSMLTQLFATRLGADGIPVYEVRPGVIKTDMTAGVTAKYDDLISKGLCVQPRWGFPQDIGLAVASLARGDFPFSTGQVVMVDGGLTIPRL